MKKIGKAIIVAFSIYSKIPMPHFNWESEDMQYHLCFFPWVGAVIGALEFGWYFLTRYLGIGLPLQILLAAAIPLLVTGGFHMDGFMDTCDALHSYQDREKKLEILKDPHIGAFAVICLLAYMLLALGFLSEVDEIRAAGVGCAGFFLSRTLSGISVVTMPSAKKKGMLQTFSGTAAKKTVLGCLIFQLVLCGALQLVICWYMGLVSLVLAGLSYLYYWRMSKKQFGGITGDLAGFFVTVTELLIVMGLGVICILMR